MEILKYISLAATTWFAGFFPHFEIYLAVPVGLSVGLNWFDAFLWASLGNWMVIPLIDFFYDWLMKFKFMKKFSEKSLKGKWRTRLEKYGAFFIVVLTPVTGVWVIGIIAKALKFNRVQLWLYSGISVGVTGFVIAVLANMGIQLFS
ncbi:small multi-drug export protein [Evansella tamaricis]|uniref:Small multi-drug export protein n=1 Tax=Evansella tamaricis TaxID=2069301 RepID=A0ABS6JDF8_9BACI|nr:small multi-drug export protein [Evansella tamaricis]MBU9711611.1 small multi-drug export protein [Evansella tamaricis]MBU9713238.1 small multi-drug export protein [Evansella tamaricis]